ncbi:hypothetical protein PRB79_gp52 [Klebsiella phage VLCpiS13d]|uniref:hypothetical protein n=1 Tax=Klebsiella phage VLCpiS13d TaxID=2874888 RepID=UPI00233EF5A5|nr:hypothetical protein PRB79_gp52 [Klebsiella phage VLCpiS13d]UVX31736.1 hypothetical protein S13d_00073 [Klebsiella phage VLCpiS13d]
MYIEINEVQEIIKNLEIGSELSIKEEKYLKVAKLCVQLAEENVGMKGAIPQLKNIDYQNESMDDVTLAEDIGFNAAVMAMHRWIPKTPATDRIVAGIKADGVEEFAAHLRANYNGASVCKIIALGADDFAKQLREGADK